MERRDVVTFLSDYGLEDEFVGVCHGVMLRIAPWLKVVHLHHYILRHDIRHGSIVLRQSIEFLPDAVHLAVVDPSVGSDRRAVAVTCSSGAVFVGPDNGLLMAAVDRCGGVEDAHEIRDERYVLSPVSRTFQGRDLFAPAAAHIASGTEPSELGPPVDPNDLVRLDVPESWVHDDHVHAEVLQVDRFGNLQLNVPHGVLQRLGLTPPARAEVRMEGHRLNVPFCNTFSDVEEGEFILIEDSYHQVSLAINNGDAARRLQAKARSTAIVGPTRS
ncbi:MAG TPA: SAM-dependent chlorinase/fluorinase [Actinomycetota bacterium]|nr:SAM-dependent chlorinase/fluorinase [Actinomycetota bacterium]